MAPRGFKTDIVCFSRENDDWGLYVYDGWRVFDFPRFEKGKSRNTGVPHDNSNLYARGSFEFVMQMRRDYR